MLSFCARSSLPVHFTREEVAITIHPGIMEIKGNYHILSSAKNAISVIFFFPFPLDSIIQYPDSIAIFGYQFTKTDSGVSFKKRFRPQSEDSFYVYYRQPLRGNSARYIVTTIRRWKRPVDLASFTVRVPIKFKDVRLNWTP
ncbi:MAG: hypothetical protein ABIK18_03190, partial [candidate division WOR-3 bacterium]